jgi:hypothetical protein
MNSEVIDGATLKSVVMLLRFIYGAHKEKFLTALGNEIPIALGENRAGTDAGEVFLFKVKEPVAPAWVLNLKSKKAA